MIMEGSRALNKPSWVKNDPRGTSSVKTYFHIEYKSAKKHMFHCVKSEDKVLTVKTRVFGTHD